MIAATDTADDQEVGLPVDVFYDRESRNWGFRVPALGIIGGGDTRDDAIRSSRDAIAFTLEGDDRTAEGERVYVRATLHLPATPTPA